MIINVKVDTESERILTKLTNYLIEKGFMYQADVDEVCVALTDNEKKNVLGKLLALKYVSHKEGVYQYKDVIYDTVVEEEIFRSIIKPDYVNITKEFAQIGNNYYYCMYTETLPPTTRINWLYQLAAEKGNVDFSIHVHPTNPGDEIKELEKEMSNIQYDIAISPKPEPSLQQKVKQILQKIEELSDSQLKSSTVDMYFSAKAPTPEKAETLAKTVKSNLSSGRIDVKMGKNVQQPLVKSLLPLGVNFLKAREISVPTDALGESDPYSYPWLDIDEDEGILLGFNDNGLPIAKSIWKLQSYSGIVIGTTGSGKSFTAKTVLDKEHMVNQTNIIIIDPAASRGQEPEYKRMCEVKKGAYINFSTHSKNIPNINSLYGDSYQDALIDVSSLYFILLGDTATGTVSDAQKPIIEEALTRMYELAGVTEDTSTWKKVPTIDAMESIIKKQLNSAVSQKTKESCEALLKRLRRFTGRGLYNFINTKGSDLNLDNTFTVFAFQDTPDEIKPVLTAIIMNYIRGRVGRQLKRTLVVIDEAHIWLKNPVLSSYILRMVKTLRKTNTGILLIFQDILDLQNCQEGYGVLANVEFKFIMGVKPSSIKLTSEKLDLNEVESSYLSSVTKGNGLLIWGKDHYRFKVLVDEETYKVITTNPDDIKKFKEEKLSVGIFDLRTETFLKEDIGKVPKTMEEAGKIITEKIAQGNLDISIMNHYHNPMSGIIREQLRLKGIDPHSKLAGMSEETLNKIADNLHNEFFKKKQHSKKQSKKVIHKKKGKK